jgi:hypothetical protein
LPAAQQDSGGTDSVKGLCSMTAPGIEAA